MLDECALAGRLGERRKVRVADVGRLVGQVTPGEGLGDGTVVDVRDLNGLPIGQGPGSPDLHLDPKLAAIGGRNDRKGVMDRVLHGALLTANGAHRPHRGDGRPKGL